MKGRKGRNEKERKGKERKENRRKKSSTEDIQIMLPRKKRFILARSSINNVIMGLLVLKRKERGE
jgi:hypothetical protein